MSRGALAYAHARIRAHKSRLFRRTDVLPLLTATDSAGVRRALSALGIEADTAMKRLLMTYRLAIRAYPQHASLFLAMLRLHEIENVKLLWRTIANGRERNSALWIDLGPLASVPADILESATLRDAAERLTGTPYGAIAARIVKAHSGDLTAAEKAFDLWAQATVLAEAARFDVPLHFADERRSRLQFGKGKRDAGLASTDPFSLAGAVRTVLFSEAEFRGLTALIERAGNPAFDAETERVLAESLMGA